MTTVTIDYPLSSLPDDKLAGLFSATALWHQHAPSLAIVIGRAVQLEAQRRAAARNGTPIGPVSDGIAFNGDTWSDRDVGYALLLANVISLETTDPLLTEISGALSLSMTEFAANRLANSGDPRNVIPFEERNG